MEKKQPVLHRVRFSQICPVYSNGGGIYLYALDTRGQIWTTDYPFRKEKWTKIEAPEEEAESTYPSFRTPQPQPPQPYETKEK